MAYGSEDSKFRFAGEGGEVHHLPTIAAERLAREATRARLRAAAEARDASCHPNGVVLSDIDRAAEQ